MRPLLLLATALLVAPLAQAQPIVDCNCVAHLAQLQTNACQGFISDLCQLAIPCLLTPLPPQCSQNPPPGGPVGPGVYPITISFTDFSSGSIVTQDCNVFFVVKAPTSGCSTNCIPPPPGMVAWWTLDELTGATIYADSSGSGNAAIVESGGPIGSAGSPSAVVAAKVAGGGYFYGATVRGRALNSASLNFGTGNFSADSWVKPVPVGPNVWQPIVDKLDMPTPTSTYGYAVAITNNRVALWVGNGTLQVRESVNTVNFNNWNFIAVAVDRNLATVVFNVNGVTEAPQSLSLPGTVTSPNDALIGGTYMPSGSAELSIDELELFNRAIGTNEMLAIWAADSAGKCKTNPPCQVFIVCPPNQTNQTCGTGVTVTYPLPQASALCGPITNIVCTPPSGSVFPLGTTVVVCTAYDSQGNSASCTFNVTVTRDTTPPTCPPTSLSITGCPPIMPNFLTNGMITDNCTPVAQLSGVQTPAPGTVLPIGNTSASVLVCDAATNCIMCNFIITGVGSGAPPSITCPSNMVVEGHRWCETNGATVGFPLPVVTNGSLASVSPPPGSFFPFGTTLVTAIATNACSTNQCTFTVTVNSGLLIPPCVPPPPNMVMWLKFDETSGNTAFNASAGNHGTLVNNPTRFLGQYVVNSLCFNGVNQYVQVANYAAMQFGTGDFTIDAWVKPAVLGNSQRVIVEHREESGTIVRGYSLYLTNNNLLGFELADGTAVNYTSTLTVPANGLWHFVAVTVKRGDPQGIRFYVDGVQASPGSNPTGHPGSVTPNQCFPFRVASRSASVTKLFPGCIDEVELFRRSLTASELQGIYDARCKGKCRISCQPGSMQIPQCWLTRPGFSNVFVINNPLPTSQTFNWQLIPLPVGPGCTKPGPTFSPSSGTITIPGGNPGVLNVLLTYPPGFGVGDCTCYRMIVSTPDGSQQVQCDGSICVPRDYHTCVIPSTPFAQADNLDPATVTFTLYGDGTVPSVLTNPVIVMRSPENDVVSVMPMPDITVLPNSSMEIPFTFAFPEYDPGRFYSISFVANGDSSGSLNGEVYATTTAMNVVPKDEPSPDLSIRKAIGGTIIIIWPDPCATLQVNPHLIGPWTNALKQTSPVTIEPGEAGESQFFRLVK